MTFNRAPNATFLILGAGIVYAAALILVFHFVPPSGGSWDNTVKAAGVAISVATAVIGPVITIYMVIYQARVTSDLEALKTDYVKEVENLKAALSARLEVKKALIAGKVRAFDQMLGAAHFYSYAIRKQVFNAQDTPDDALIKEADHRAAEATAFVWNLSTADRNKWLLVHQHSTFLLNSTRGKPRADRIKFLDENSKPLGEAIEDLENAGRSAFEEAEQHQLRATPEDIRLFRG